MYEFFLLNIRVQGVDAVRELYTRMMPNKFPATNSMRLDKITGNLGDLIDPPVDAISI